jgi:nucleotide-binding universal stress UspA family protein
MAARRAPCPPLDDACRDHAHAILAEALASVPADIEVERRVIRGPAERLLLASADHAADLLVVGTGRTGGLTRLFHGATTRYCIAHARCPVLAVPPSELIRDLTDLEGHKSGALASSMVREGLRGV